MSTTSSESRKILRCGWTTGTCATAATRSACHALMKGPFLDPVTVQLPQGQTPEFSLIVKEQGKNWARAGIVKDAGDDPDVTHGAVIIATLRKAKPGTGISFSAGEGVGTVTKAGLPLPPGEPAINPAPRAMMQKVVLEIATQAGLPPDIDIEISVPNGAKLAKKTWNPRLGILGGLSILGTTGIVRPFSCSAWIHAIHRGIDVARAQNLPHLIAATGSVSEKAACALYQLPQDTVIDMGDFVGGMLKYLRKHPVKQLSIAGGLGKMTKLAQGHMDLHAKRSAVSFSWLAKQASALNLPTALVESIATAHTAKHVFDLCASHGSNAEELLANHIAREAQLQVQNQLGKAEIHTEILIINRQGNIVGRA